MKFIYAKFASRCAETGLPIAAGERVLWHMNAKKVYSIRSSTYRKAKEDSFSNYMNANPYYF